MTKTTKIAAVGFLSLAIIGAFSLAFSSKHSHSVEALDCSHEGNHYDVLASTSTTGGTSEYWVCCKCHQHFLSYTDGIWTDAGTASRVDQSDDRYIPPITSGQQQLMDELAAMGFTAVANSDGETCDITAYDGRSNQVNIPEGVQGIKAGTFAGNKLQWIVLPSTISDAEIQGMVATGAAKVTLYFVGDTSYTAGKNSDQLNVKAIYKVEGVGWHWSGNTPVAGK